MVAFPLREKFCHGSAVAFRQESVLTAGIVPLFNGDGVKESPPQHAKMEFLITRKSKLQTIHLHNAGVTFCIDQQFFMSAVVDEEGLVGITCAEVIAQQRKYTVFRLNLCTQYAAIIGKTDEATQFLKFPIHVPQRLGDGVIHLIGGVADERRPFIVELADKSIEVLLLVGEAGEKAAPHNIACRLGAGGNAVVDTLPFLGFRSNKPHFIETATILIAAKGDGEFFMDIALEHAAKKAFKAAVILKNNIAPCHRITPLRRKEIVAAPRYEADRHVPPPPTAARV